MHNTFSTDDALVLYGQRFSSRLLLGTARYPSPAALKAAVERARPAMVTASLRRQGSNPAESGQGFWELLSSLNVPVLPNTANCHSVQEAITTAHMAREVFNTPWIKLEVIGDDYTLQPDTLNLVAAAEKGVGELEPLIHRHPLPDRFIHSGGFQPLLDFIGDGLHLARGVARTDQKVVGK